MDDYIFLEEEEFNELEPDAKWSYIQHMRKMLDELKIQADKNCQECEKNMMSPEDINISMLFEDWRDCAEHCDKCTKQDQINMCEIQFDLMNHLADGVGRLTNKINILTKLYLQKDKEGNKLIKDLREKEKQQKRAHRELYQ